MGYDVEMIFGWDKAHRNLHRVDRRQRQMYIRDCGFGRSDVRDVLRRFFEVDRHQIVLAALDSLSQEGKVDRKMLTKAIDLYGIAVDTPDPWSIWA